MSKAAAVEAAPLLADVESGPGAIQVRVKLSGDGKEFKVNTWSQSTVAQFKAQVSEVIEAEGNYLRCIAAGKMLTPDTATLSDFKVTGGSFVHVVVSTTAPRVMQPCMLVVDDNGDEEEEDDGQDPGDRRGFDRLRNQGMTMSQVTALRSYFTTQVRQFAEEHDIHTVEAGESDWDRQLRCEDAWVAAQTGTSEFAFNTASTRRSDEETGLGGLRHGGNFSWGISEDAEAPGVGSTKDFIFGFVMGFFLGFIMLFWLWEASVPHKQKMGICAGVMLQLCMNFLRRSWVEDQ
ncbi:unnamed protein product [Chrysoparadoxa australica]